MDNSERMALLSKMAEASEASYWAVEIDEGKSPRMYLNKFTKALLGLEDKLTPEEAYTKWYELIDNAHRDIVENAIKNMVDGKKVEVQYPLNKNENEVIYLRCVGSKNGSYKNGIRCEGYCQDITELVQIQLSEKDKYTSVIDTTVNDCELILYIDLNTGDYEPFKASSSGVNMFSQIKGNNYFETVENFVDTRVPEEDRRFIKTKINRNKIIKAINLDGEYAFDTRALFEGKIYWLQFKYSAYKPEEKKNVVVLAIRNVTSNRLEEIKQIQELAVISGLAKDYTYVTYLNPIEHRDVIYKEDTNGILLYDKVKRKSYPERLKDYAKKLVHPEDRDYFLRETSGPAVLKALEKSDTHRVNFRIVQEDGVHYCEIKFVSVRDRDDLVGVIAGFHNVDKEHENEQKEIESRRVFELLATEYQALYGVSLKDYTYKIYKTSKEVLDSVGYMLKNNKDFTDMLRELVNITYEEDKPIILDLANNFRKLFDENLRFKRLYRRVYSDGNFYYTEILCMKISADADYGIVSFRNVHQSEIEKQDLQMKELRNKETIQSLSEDYLYVCYVDIYRNEITRVAASKSFLPYLAPYDEFSKIPTEFDDLLKRIIIPEDFNMFLDNVNREFVMSKLDYETYTTDFRANLFGKVINCRMKIAKDKNTNFGVVIGIYDVSKEYEQQAMLKEALEKAQKANEAKDTFLFNMSHDIRTPMNAITGFSSMGKKYIDNKEKVLDCFDKIEMSGKQLLSLANQILEMSKIESGKIVLDEKPADIIDRTNAILSIMDVSAEEHDITLEGNLKNIRNKDIVVDSTRLNQIFTNIIGNAIKYTNAGGLVKFTVEQLKNNQAGYGSYRFVVEDNGRGMSEEYVDHIFEAFSRESTVTKTGIEGSGLGMAIVKNLVDVMGGQISVESKVNKGTKVTIDFDFKLKETQSEKEAKDLSLVISKLKGKRIILAEDNELNREIAVDILEEFGLLVDEANDGDVAVDLLKKSIPGYYSFILMDIQMPKMNGYEATKEIRNLENKDLANTPIIAMTANAFDDDKQKSHDAGMNAHLSKPIDVSKLLEVLTQIQL